MAYLPGFDNDVFISYTHKDNLGPGALPDAGWVTRFHLDLQQRLTEFLGVHARIWRDKKLRGSDDYSEEIFSQQLALDWKDRERPNGHWAGNA
ncbi:MAG: hypothetical protein ACT4QB_14435 [Gammaproteobacteria bacterium]